MDLEDELADIRQRQVREEAKRRESQQQPATSLPASTRRLGVEAAKLLISRGIRPNMIRTIRKPGIRGSKGGGTLPSNVRVAREGWVLWPPCKIRRGILGEVAELETEVSPIFLTSSGHWLVEWRRKGKLEMRPMAVTDSALLTQGEWQRMRRFQLASGEVWTFYDHETPDVSFNESMKHALVRLLEG